MRLGGILNAAAGITLRLALAAIFLLALGTSLAQDAGRSIQVRYEGTLGPARIGLTLVVKSGSISGGHYFYAKYLTISLSPEPASRAPSLCRATMAAPVRSGSSATAAKAGKPLNFDNSVGLEGAWSKDGEPPGKAHGCGAIPGSAEWPLVRDGHRSERRRVRGEGPGFLQGGASRRPRRGGKIYSPSRCASTTTARPA